MQRGAVTLASLPRHIFEGPGASTVLAVVGAGHVPGILEKWPTVCCVQGAVMAPKTCPRLALCFPVRFKSARLPQIITSGEMKRINSVPSRRTWTGFLFKFVVVPVGVGLAGRAAWQWYKQR